MLAARKGSVQFSENLANYIAAYRYVCKSDRNVLLSPGHPDLDLTVFPRRRRSSTNKKSTEPPQKTKRYFKAKVMDMIKDKFIKNEIELLALAATQAENGLMLLKNVVANTPRKNYRELIAKACAMAEDEQVVQRKSHCTSAMFSTKPM